MYLPQFQAIQNAAGPLPTAWVPANLGAALALWFDAADVGTITQTAGVVAQWADKSGGGRHQAQATTGKRPTYNATALNGLGGVVFTASSSQVLVGSSPSATGAIFVVSNSTNTSYGGFFSGVAEQAGINNYWFINALSGPALENEGTGLVRTFYVNGTATQSYTAGSARLFSGINPSPLSNTTNCQLGADRSYGRYLNGSVNELIVINTVPTTAMQQTIEGYLAWKWGLQASLPVGHAYKNAAP